MKLYTRLVAALLISGTCVLSANAQLYWDINTDGGTGGNGTATPTGTWDDLSTNWNINPDGSGAPGAWTPDSTAVFAAGGDATGTYTVTLGAPESVGGINFEEGTVTIGGTNALTLSGSGIIDVAAGKSATISAPIAGGSFLAKNSNGTLTLSADNTTAGFAGAVDINGGTLSVTNGGALGPGGDFSPITVHDGGTLQVSGAITVPAALTINGNGFNTTGAIRKTANNVTTLTGGVTLGADARIQAEAGTLTFSTKPIAIAGNTVTFNNAGTLTLSGATMLTGSGTIIKDGAGVMNVGTTAVDNGGWAGKWVVKAGTLRHASNENGFTDALGSVAGGFVADKITLDGGTLSNSYSATNALNFVHQSRGIQLTSNGGALETTVATAGWVTIYSSGDNTTTSTAGTGGRITMQTGTTSATLTKTGPAELRVQGTGTGFYDFTKLAVKGGLYRTGSVLFGAVQQSKETGFGATPASFIADQILLDGGSIGSSFSVTLNANRGVTIGAAGGGLSGGLTVAGAITSQTPGVGTLTQNTGSNILSSASNATTFDGNLAANGGTLQLNSSLNARNFSGTASGTSAADVNIGGTNTKLTVGNGSPTNTTFNGRILGTGKFRKVGSNTITFDMAGTGNVLNLTGTAADVFVIDGGGITFANTIATSVSGFNAALAGTLSMQINNGTLDLTVLPLAGGVYSHNVGSLNSTATTGSLLIGTNNITLGQTATTARSYLGKITSTGGALTKAGTTFTQTLGAGNTLAAVNVNAGRLNFTGASTTGAVAVASGGALGGAGSVTGAVSVASGGTLSPGVASTIGTFGEGALSLTGGSTFEYELNSSGSPAADLLNVNGGLSLGGSTLTGLDLAAVSASLSAGTKFTLMSYSGAWDSSTFAGLNNGDPITIGANTFNIKYNDTTGGINAGSLYSNFVTLAIPGAAGLLGDFNSDGKVDASDYVTWRKNDVANASLPNDSGAGTQAARYSLWRANFGKPPGAGSGGGLSGASAVPEPSSIALLMIALAAMVTRRRGR